MMLTELYDNLHKAPNQAVIAHETRNLGSSMWAYAQHTGLTPLTCCEDTKTTKGEGYTGLGAKRACTAHVDDDG